MRKNIIIILETKTKREIKNQNKTYKKENNKSLSRGVKKKNK
jgi:hypothetical protein